MQNRYDVSPCVGCIRVADPAACENKECTRWRRWFLGRWEQLRGYTRQVMDRSWEPVGVCIGGRVYAHPVQVRSYLKADPCHRCHCPEQLCRTPCRARQQWAKTTGEVTQ